MNRSAKATCIALLVVLFSHLSYAKGSDDLRELAYSKQWLRLLHFKKSFPFGTLKSEVDDTSFFFSPQGGRDPYAELLASIQAFHKHQLVGKLQLSAECAFPARYHYLRQQLQWSDPEPECEDLERFLKTVGGDTLGLVFSTAYPNSPPSMFGHTLIRVHSKSRAELLDYGINFAALSSPDDNAIAFAVLGFFGGYHGNFGIEPYYMKVNEYNHAESRDLWEYELNLSRQEIRFFLMHLFEIVGEPDTSGRFRYYFTDENCSYRLLTLLEVAKPDWDLSRFALEVVPAETVKRITAIPGAVRSIHHRPSQRSLLKARYRLLNSEQQSLAWNLTEGKTDPTKVSDALALETTIAIFQERLFRNKGQLIPTDREIYTEVLKRRAELGQQKLAEIPDPDPENRPELGHSPYQLSAGGGAQYFGSNSAVGFGELRFKFAYHDLLNSDVGYLPFSHVDFPNLTLRYSPSLSSFWIERLGLMTVTSLMPLTSLEKQLSWKVDLAYESAHDLNCINCHVAMLGGGPGASIHLFSERYLFDVLALAHVETGSAITGTGRFNPRLESSILANPVNALKLDLAAAYVVDPWQTERQSHYYELSWSNAWALGQNWDARAIWKGIVPGDRQKAATYQEWSLTLNRFF